MTDKKKVIIHKPWFYIGIAFVTLVLIALGVYLFSHHLTHYSNSLVHWVSDKVGFWGMALLLLVSDSVISPLPPDAILYVIANGPLKENGNFYLIILGMASVIGGHLGWWFGGHFSQMIRIKKILGTTAERSEVLIKRYGFWAVVLGAATPVPFSVTCWIAGMLKMKLKFFFLATLFRIPRLYIYYWVILYSSEIKFNLEI